MHVKRAKSIYTHEICKYTRKPAKYVLTICLVEA